MTDYIDRAEAEAIFRNARKHLKPENCTGQEFSIRDNILLNAEQIIHLIPASDVVPVRHGRWEKKHDNVCYWYECSECGEKPPKDQWKNQWLSSYCPNCGANMMGMEDDEDGV